MRPVVLAGAVLAFLSGGCAVPGMSSEQRVIEDPTRSLIALQNLQALHPEVPLVDVPDGWAASWLQVRQDGYRIEIHQPAGNGEYRLLLVCVSAEQARLSASCNSDGPAVEIAPGWFGASAPPEAADLSFTTDSASLEAGMLEHGELWGRP